jgi:hypothetical protein
MEARDGIAITAAAYRAIEAGGLTAAQAQHFFLLLLKQMGMSLQFGLELCGVIRILVVIGLQ